MLIIIAVEPCHFLFVPHDDGFVASDATVIVIGDMIFITMSFPGVALQVHVNWSEV